MTMNSGCIETKELERVFFGLAIEAQKEIPPMLQRSRKKVIILAGPTGCGKSEFALDFCSKVNGEIISGDSIQVYRGMDIGTAKPTKQEQALLPHHLIDIRDLKDPFNVVDFYYEARHACQTVIMHENIPVIVGGSGFYLHSLLYGPPSGPPSVPELRKTLEEEIEQKGSEVLYERLRQLDEDYARTITKHDKQKIVRALEIITLTNKKVSKLSWKNRNKPLNYDFRCWFFHRPKEILYSRIEKRCEKMLERGFLEEVEALIPLGIETNSSASQAIGYRQALEFLKSNRTKEDYKNFVEAFKQASRHYAKRQMTWFRREPLFRWIDLEAHDPEVVMDIIEQDFEQSI